jgi:transcriptional regulator with XRE-family HTH domain
MIAAKKSILSINYGGGMKKKDLAQKLGISPGYLSKILSGRSIGWALAQKLSDKLGRSPVWWMRAGAPEVQGAISKKLGK